MIWTPRNRESVVGRRRFCRRGEIPESSRLRSPANSPSLCVKRRWRAAVAWRGAAISTRRCPMTWQEQEAERLLQTVRDLERPGDRKADASRLARRRSRRGKPRAPPGRNARGPCAEAGRTDRSGRGAGGGQAHEQMTRMTDGKRTRSARGGVSARQAWEAGGDECTGHARTNSGARRHIDLRDKTVGAREQAATDLAVAVADRDAGVRGRERSSRAGSSRVCQKGCRLTR